MSQAGIEAGRISGRRLTCVLVVLLAGAVAAASTSARIGELRARLSQLDAGGWNPAAEQAFARDLDALVAQMRGGGNPGAAAAEMRRLVADAHRRHGEWLERAEREFLADDDGADPFESEEAIERRQMAMQTLYLRNWVDLESATAWQPSSPDRAQWLRRAVDGFGRIAAVDDRTIAAESHYGRALAYRALGQFEPAAADFARAIELSPEQFAARAGTALVEMQLERDRIAEALAASQKLLADHRSAEAEFLRAKSLLLALAAPGGKGAVRAAQRSEVADLIARLERRGGQWPELARRLVAAGIARPEEWLDAEAGPTIRWTVAESLRAQGRCGDALPLYKALFGAGKSPRAELAVAYAECRFRAGDHAGVLQTLQTVDARSDVAGNAAYLRFKAAEALHHAAPTPASGAQLLELAGAFADAHPRHQRAYEAQFRLGELLRERGERLAAAAMFDAVSGDAGLRLQALFQSAQCYVEEWEMRERSAGVDAARDLGAAAIERLDRFRSEATAMTSARSARPADAAVLAPMQARAEVLAALVRARLGGEEYSDEAIVILDGFDERYAGEAELRPQAAAVRGVALLGLGRYAEARAAIEAFVAVQRGSERDYELMRGLGVRALALAGEQSAAGDVAAAADLRAAALAIYSALLAAAERGALAAESPHGLRQLVDDLRRQTES